MEPVHGCNHREGSHWINMVIYNIFIQILDERKGSGKKEHSKLKEPQHSGTQADLEKQQLSSSQKVGKKERGEMYPGFHGEFSLRMNGMDTLTW